MANTTTAAIAEDTILDPELFARMLGVAPATLPGACVNALQQQPLTFRRLRGEARETQLLRALRASDEPGLRTAGPHRAADWEAGWAENLHELVAGQQREALIPRYNHHRVLRLQGDYVQVADPAFEYGFYTALRHYLFARWLSGLQRVVEFGCGTGTSLLLLAEMEPDRELWGLDWAPASQQILAEMAARTGYRLHGQRCDMFAPAGGVPLGRGTGVFTSAAMEQLGTDHGALLEHLLAGDPEICLHIEPLFELYDRASLFDEVALRYHQRRNYLRGFLPRLRELEAQGRIEILTLHRPGFGSFHHEGYSFVVWRPRRGAQR